MLRSSRERGFPSGPASSLRCGGSRAARGAGFTLLELLVSVTLAMFLMGVAWTMFAQVQRLVKRTQSRLHLHASAKAIFESLRRDLTALQPSCAFWLKSTPGASGPGSVDLVFMTAATDDQGFRISGNDNFDYAFTSDTTDLVWCRWSWTGGDQRLMSARNDLTRTFARKQSGDPTPTNAGLTYSILGYYKYGTSYNAQPRRFTAGDDVTLLDDNRWNITQKPGLNRGDWSDLALRLAPVHNAVTACTMEVVLAGGTQTRRADGGAALDFCSRGVRLDGITELTMTGAGHDEIAERPSILRIGFTLEDRNTRISEDFSFSFALPGPGKHF